MNKPAKIILSLIAVLALGSAGLNGARAQTSPSVLYVPLIGISSVPFPLALPNGSGTVTYHYAVKNFLAEVPLSNVQVADNQCSPVKFTEGDDNNNGYLDYSETWRYECSVVLSQTTQSVATVTGNANNMQAVHKAYATVVVGSSNLPPLVSIINITKIAYPLSLPVGGGNITFTYKVNNPGAVPLSQVKVSDDKCPNMSGKLGDTNGNNLLNVNEVWIYTCTVNLEKTTTNTVTVTAFANGLKAVGDATVTVKVETPADSALATLPNLPDAGISPNFKIIVWFILLIIFAALIIYASLNGKKKLSAFKKKSKLWLKLILLLLILTGTALAMGFYYRNKVAPEILADASFGWKFPVVKFPLVGPNPSQLAYSDIRDPGGVPQGLPVRLKIPIIGVDSAIEDALITTDGRMDVPSGSTDVAWFALGPHPGQAGSAVIGGHFGISKGAPFVFYNLDKLKVGDKVYIVDDKEDTLAFIVKSIKLFDRNADATTVFTSTDGLAHLNLITCEGIWNQVNNTYPERRVVFTDAINSASAAVVPEVKKVFIRTLSLGSKGDDVIALQTILEAKGLLKMPAKSVKGYFGYLTRTALIKYQKSVGLGANGIFNQLTRSKMIAEQSVAEVKVSLPITAITNDVVATSSQTISQSFASMLATPLDKLITFGLLIAILVAAFKIIRL